MSEGDLVLFFGVMLAVAAWRAWLFSRTTDPWTRKNTPLRLLVVVIALLVVIVMVHVLMGN